MSALKAKLLEEDAPSAPGSDGLSAVLKPFRILISLLDKPEIGPVIIENVLLSVFRRLKIEGAQYAQSEGSRTTAVVVPEGCLPMETHKTANLLFGSFEPYFIWDFIARMFKAACEQSCKEQEGIKPAEAVSISELCELVEFLLDVIALVCSHQL